MIRLTALLKRTKIVANPVILALKLEKKIKRLKRVTELAISFVFL